MSKCVDFAAFLLKDISHNAPAGPNLFPSLAQEFFNRRVYVLGFVLCNYIKRVTCYHIPH